MPHATVPTPAVELDELLDVLLEELELVELELELLLEELELELDELLDGAGQSSVSYGPLLTDTSFASLVQ